MNRNNVLGHLAIALVLILAAAFAGQVRKWRHEWNAVRPSPSLSKENSAQTADDESEEAEDSKQDDSKHAEVLVRFRPGTTQEAIQNLLTRFNDEVEDRIE